LTRERGLAVSVKFNKKKLATAINTQLNTSFEEYLRYEANNTGRVSALTWEWLGWAVHELTDKFLG
jgi:hypothetical protein